MREAEEARLLSERKEKEHQEFLIYKAAKDVINLSSYHSLY